MTLDYIHDMNQCFKDVAECFGLPRPDRSCIATARHAKRWLVCEGCFGGLGLFVCPVAGSIGRGLCITTGWTHRISLAHYDVEILKAL